MLFKLDPQDEKRKKTKKEKMREIIQKSKEAKKLRQRIKDEVVEKVGEVNELFSHIQGKIKIDRSDELKKTKFQSNKDFYKLMMELEGKAYC